MCVIHTPMLINERTGFLKMKFFAKTQFSWRGKKIESSAFFILKVKWLLNIEIKKNLKSLFICWDN